MIDLTDSRGGAEGRPRDADGTLVLGGVRADVLARAYGTPLLAFDQGALDAAIGEFVAAGRAADVEVAYAAKALLFVRLARHLRTTQLALDVCSLGELHTAERAEFPAERMYLHGCGKTDEELRAALAGRVATLIVDNVFELERLAELAGGRPCSLVLRVNVGIEAHTHEFVRTAGENTKFGLGAGEFASALALLGRAPGLRLVGIHSHLGSQIFEPAPLVENVGATLQYVRRAIDAGHPVELAILGGGFGVAERGDGHLDLGPLFADMRARADRESSAAGLPPLRLGVEPGRAIVGRAGTSLYRIVATKRFGKRRFVIVDGGMADNPRPALYGAFHSPIVAASAARGPLTEVTICGRSCENDELVDAHLPEDLVPGDLLALTTTGAYTFSMASNYNRFPRPPVVWLREGSHELAVRRESFDDLTRADVV